MPPLPKGEALAGRKAQKNPLSEIGAPGGGLSFWVSQWTHLLLPLSLLLYAILPKSQALHRKFTSLTSVARPVFVQPLSLTPFDSSPSRGASGEEVKLYGLPKPLLQGEVARRRRDGEVVQSRACPL